MEFENKQSLNHKFSRGTALLEGIAGGGEHVPVS